MTSPASLQPASTESAQTPAAVIATTSTLSQPSRRAETIIAHVTTTTRSIQQLVGESPAMQRLVEQALEAASVKWSLLITGETGTGKTSLARFIHEHSERACQPFIKINCAAIPKELAESHLFGHVKGAFTGAVSDQAGAFEQAQGGTLFLDEIGDLSLDLQSKLLTAIEEKSFSRVGSHRPLSVNVRIICATKYNLKEMVETGQFREDLYYRISFLEIEAPALRERTGDIPALAHTLIARCARELNVSNLELSDEALLWLCAQNYPGNIRDLHRTISRLALLAIRSKSALIAREHVQKLALAQPPANATAQESGAPCATDVINLKETDNLKDVVARVQLAIIERTLEINEHNYTRTAERLGINRSHFTELIKKLRDQSKGTGHQQPVAVIVC